MDSTSRTRNNKYDRVMSRVHNQSRTSLKSSSFVTRHDIPSSVRFGAKSVASNVSSSGVFNELPTFLNDYAPESGREKVKRTYVVKPRRTIKSLDVPASPPRTTKQREFAIKSSNIRAQGSAPSVLINNGEKWSATHFRECLSSRSHSRLKDIKDEIKAYKEAEKLMRLRSSLFKKCGVVLDDVGNMAEDKAVQAQLTEEEAQDTGQTAQLRYPNEYAAPPEGTLLPEDLPDDMYKNLIDERPELESILGPSRKTKVRRPKMPKTLVLPSESAVYHEFEYPRRHREEEDDERPELESIFGPSRTTKVRRPKIPKTIVLPSESAMYNEFEYPQRHREEEDDYGHGDEKPAGRLVRYTDQPGLAHSTTDSAAAKYTRRLSFLSRNQTHNDTRRYNYISDYERAHPPWASSPVVATCYTCGEYTYPPKNPICHDVFDSQDWRARTMKRFFRSKCHYNFKWQDEDLTTKYPYGFHNSHIRSYKIGRLGIFLPGCYKRFLDFGKVYTERGCRSPSQALNRIGNGRAVRRFEKLEQLLRHHSDQCITSSHASLTPFSRGISLFARYHVCVCVGRYCNRATLKASQISLLFLSLIFIALYNVMNVC